MRRLPVLILAVAAGCGGDSPSGDGASRSEPPLSVADYRAKANRICLKGEREAAAVSAPRAPREIGPYLKRTQAIAEANVKELGALRSPAQFEDRHSKAVASYGSEIRLIRTAIQRIESGEAPDATLVALSPKLEQAHERTHDEFRALGLRDCYAHERGPSAPEQSAPS